MIRFHLVTRIVAALAAVAVAGCSGAGGSTSGPLPGTALDAAAGTALVRRTFHEYPIPTANSQPTSITLGPDGNMWFTEQNGGAIGKITPTGQISEYVVGVGSEPTDIIAGPDGNLWATLLGGNGSILKMTTAGVMTTTYALPVGSRPYHITVGPDRNLWFTESGIASAIGRLTLSGQLSTFPVSVNSEPLDITVGPDNKLWFTETNANKIGKMTTSGTYVEYPATYDAGNQSPIPTGIKTADNKSIIVSRPYEGDLLRVALNGTPIARYVNSAPGSPGAQWIMRSDSKTLWLGDGHLQTFNLSRDAYNAEIVPPTGIVGDVYNAAIGLEGRVWYVEIGEGAIGVVSQ